MRGAYAEVLTGVRGFAQISKFRAEDRRWRDYCAAMSESLSSQSDADLLKRFSKTRCELAFEELVDRYGRLVMSISSRALQNQHDAEDVFQATFLVLAKNANKIRKRESLPSWLSGVAYRLSMKLALKRHRKDLALNAEPQAARDHFADLERRFDEQAMDEELQSLPSKYREVLVRFYFLGQTSRQIAEVLGITQGAADGRIKRGRQELRVRLAKRGVALGAFTVMALSAKTASAAVAPSLAKSAVAAAVAKSSVGVVTPAAMKLVGSELMRTSSMISSAVVTTAAVAVLAVGTFGLNAAFARSMAATHPMNLIDTRTEELEESPPIVGAVAQESSNQKAVPELKGDVVIKSNQKGEEALRDVFVRYRESLRRRVGLRNDPRVQQVAGLLEENTEPGTNIPDVYEFKDRDPAKVRAEVLKELPQTQTKVQGQYLAIFGSEQHRKKVAKIIRKIEPNAKVGQAKLRPQMQQAAFADQNVEMGDPNVRAQDRYVLENMPAADAIEKIQEIVPKAELADFGGNVLLMIGPMELRGAVSDAVAEIDPNARKTVHQLIRPAQQAAAPPSSSAGGASGTFITAKLSQDGKSIAVDMPNGKPVTETYDVNVPFVVNGKTLIQKQRRNRIVAPAGPSRKLFKTSEIVISTVGGARPTEAQVREQLDGKKPIILLQADQKLSDFHRNTLRQSMIMISIPRQDAGPKKQKQKANDPEARTIEPLGIELAPIDTRTRRLLVDERITGGLRVVSVVEGGAADKRGVRVGDILIGLNRWETTDFRELDYVLRQESTWTNHSVFYVARSSEGEYSRFFGALKLAGLKPGAIR